MDFCFGCFWRTTEHLCIDQWGGISWGYSDYGKKLSHSLESCDKKCNESAREQRIALYRSDQQLWPLEWITSSEWIFVLKGNPSEGASWPENRESAWLFWSFAGFVCLILSICKQQKYFCASNLTLVLTWWSHIGLLFTNEEQDTKPLLCCVHAGRERNDWQPCQPRPRRRRKSFRKRYSKRLVRSWVRIGETESCSVFV